MLQVRSSSLLTIGDNNRTYNLRLACVKVENVNEKKAFDWLKLKLPRHTRVNIRPNGYTEGYI